MALPEGGELSLLSWKLLGQLVESCRSWEHQKTPQADQALEAGRSWLDRMSWCEAYPRLVGPVHERPVLA